MPLVSKNRYLVKRGALTQIVERRGNALLQVNFIEISRSKLRKNLGPIPYSQHPRIPLLWHDNDHKEESVSAEIDESWETCEIQIAEMERIPAKTTPRGSSLTWNLLSLIIRRSYQITWALNTEGLDPTRCHFLVSWKTPPLPLRPDEKCERQTDGTSSVSRLRNRQRTMAELGQTANGKYSSSSWEITILPLRLMQFTRHLPVYIIMNQWELMITWIPHNVAACKYAKGVSVKTAYS